jgi:hypothetical protein
MNLLTFTPTGAVPPIERLIEAVDNPYATPEETPRERAARMQRRGDYDATGTIRQLLHTRQRRIKQYLQAETGVPDWQIFQPSLQKEYTEVVPGLFVRDQVLQKIPATSPLFKVYKRYQDKLDHYQEISRRADTAASTAQRMETKAAKKLVAASAKPKVVDHIPNVVMAGKESIKNPYFTKLNSVAMSKYNQVKFTGHPLQTKLIGNNAIRRLAKVTTAVQRNKIDWNNAYGYYLYSKTAIPPLTNKDLRAVRWLFTTTGGLVWLHSIKTHMFYNARGSSMDEDAFIDATDKVQDDFIQGKV